MVILIMIHITIIIIIGCGQMGSTLMGPPQKYLILTDWGKRYALALLGRYK